MIEAENAIGVFDSGVGGLTVLRALSEELPREDTVYYGDTARVPYGPKSAETITRFALEVLSFSRSVLLVAALLIAASVAIIVVTPLLEDFPDLVRFEIPLNPNDFSTWSWNTYKIGLMDMITARVQVTLSFALVLLYVRTVSLMIRALLPCAVEEGDVL